MASEGKRAFWSIGPFARIPPFAGGIHFSRPRIPVLVLAAVAALLMARGALYLRTSREVVINVDGQRLLQLKTREGSVGAALRQVGIQLHKKDVVEPPLNAPLRGNENLVLQRARAVLLVADGRKYELHTHGENPSQVLQEASVLLGTHDRIEVGGKGWEPLKTLPRKEEAPLEIVVHRAIPLRVQDDGVQTTIYTFASTVGQALYEAGLVLYLGDRVVPRLDSKLPHSGYVYIIRSKPVKVLVDGRVIKTRTHERDIAGLLKEVGVELVGKDYAIPPVNAAIVDNLEMQVVRRVEETFIKKESIPYQELLRPDPNLEIDQIQLVQSGRQGVKNYQYRIIYEDGKEVKRVLERVWTEPAPTDQITAYGSKIVVRELNTPEGPVRYWRKMRVLITSYNEATCDKPRDHPAFGITYLGWRVFRGVVAVDPQVISLQSKLYVPGYGISVAGDTGGMIKGLHIDLYFPEQAMELWYKWQDIYLLEPVPPPSQIRWILPNYPRRG